jgi:putative transposase
MKLRIPRFGYHPIAQQISHPFGSQIDKDFVRRAVAKYCDPDHPCASGPFSLTFFAHSKDSLWSAQLFRCESIRLRSYWVLVVIDVFTRRMIGFGIGPEYIGGPSVCRIFNQAISGTAQPKRICTDHDPLFRFHRWLVNPRILDVEEFKSVPYAPASHSFIERLIGTIRREHLDHRFCRISIDLHRELEKFRTYYNRARVRRPLNGTTPADRAGHSASSRASAAHHAWQRHCDGLVDTPVAA